MAESNMAESNSETAAEQMALTLTQGGMQKATARVLSAFIFAENDSLTAKDLREWLGISSGGVSGAIKMLSAVGLIEQAPVPGSRQKRYRLRDDAWMTMMSPQNSMVQSMMDSAEEGIKAVGADSTPGRRLAEMRDFYAYIFRELPILIDQWKNR